MKLVKYSGLKKLWKLCACSDRSNTPWL